MDTLEKQMRKMGVFYGGKKLFKKRYGVEEKLGFLMARILGFLIQDTPLDDLPRVDGIFVFGHIDPRVALHAARLWHARKTLYSPIIVTGRGHNNLPPGYPTEASYYSAIFQDEGVSGKLIIQEHSATNTLANVVMGMMKSEQTGFYPKSLILCAIAPLLRRSIATFRKQYPEIEVYGSAPCLRVEDVLMKKEYVQRVLNELDKLKEYTQKGDIVAVEIPPKIERMAERVRKMLNLKDQKHP